MTWVFSVLRCPMPPPTLTLTLQSFAMVQARTQANSIDVWVRKSTPLVGYVHEG